MDELLVVSCVVSGDMLGEAWRELGVDALGMGFGEGMRGRRDV